MAAVPRPERHPTDSLLDAARGLVLDGGVRAATVNAVARASGAPKGSIYHRFPSLEAMLAAMWMRAARRSQARWLAALEEPDARRAAVAAAVSIHDFARDEPADGKLLVALRREDLLDAEGDPALRAELDALNQPVLGRLRELTRRLHGSARRELVSAVATATVDLPYGAVRRHLVAGTAFPPSLRAQIAAATAAALDVPSPRSTR